MIPELPPAMLPPGASHPQAPSAPDTPLIALARVVEQAPRYALDFVLGMLTAILSDPVMTSLALGCTLLALAVNAGFGGAAFFLVYVAMRTINNMAQAIGVSGRRVAASLEGGPWAPPGPGSPGGSTPE